ncbi:hypothetical protein [Flavobacterium sp. DG2-3]|uniref:hypothetical protein n=1 Tax=Flavobacterium sp. DG2-3 TaxID=3068317 RepID=UPI00273F9E54|nr:hypothetical protein [Flavobacterium sp. DG2-3]MDP5200867.1 hypothetical protein [Flavobacterium sp. DG2-3]
MKGKFKVVILLLTTIMIFSCNKKDNSFTKIHNFKQIKLYEIHCDEKVYFSLEKGKCDSMPSSYVYPKGDSEDYFCVFLRTKNGKLELYSPYNDIVKIGNITNQIDFFEYRSYEDNIFIEDSIKGKAYAIDGSTSL